MSKNTRLLILLVILGAALRLDLLFAGHWVIDSDEAIVGLMAQHIALGKAESFPVFYYGQNYMGSFEPLMAACLFWISGIFSSSVLLKLIPLAWSLALIPLGYALARRAVGVRDGGNERANTWSSADRIGLIAAAYLAVPPSPLMVWSAMARGGFIEIVVMATIALLLAIKWAEQSRSTSLTIAIGLVLGLGWWTNNQIIYAILPIGLWMLVAIWRDETWPIIPLIKHLVVGCASFIIGGLPFWWFNVTHNFVSFEMFSGAKGTKIWPQIGELFSVALPIILGAKRFWHVQDLFPMATALVWIVVCVACVIGLMVRRPSMWRFNTGLDLVVLYLLTTCAIFSLSSFGWLTSAPRYLLPIYPGIAVLVGVMLNYIWGFSKVFSFAGLIALLGFNLCSVYLGGRAIPGQPVVANGERVAQSHDALIDRLKKSSVSMIETNYWIGYRLAFETQENVRFTMFGDPAYVRIPEYEKSADAMSVHDIPLVLVPSQLASISLALQQVGMTFKSEMIGSYAVITDRRSKIESLTEIARDSIVAGASDVSDHAKLAFDGDSTTRWGSARPQAPGMEFHVTFKAPVNLKAIKLDWRDFPPDYPRALEVLAKTKQGKELVLLSQDQYRQAQPFTNKTSEITIFTEQKTTPSDIKDIVSVTLRQMGSDLKFDWSIAEARFYQ